jgi:hypothetical protein
MRKPDHVEIALIALPVMKPVYRPSLFPLLLAGLLWVGIIWLLARVFL